MDGLLCFEVTTIYKSGVETNEVIISKNEETMWEYYDKHHNSELIKDSTIIDCWTA